MSNDYVYEGTNILKNSFSLKNADDLKFVETLWIEIKLSELSDFKFNSITYDDYLSLHNYLFSGLYEWAGKERSIQINRSDSISYSNLSDIRNNGNHIVSKLDKLKFHANEEVAVKALSNSLSDLWLNHSFRNGNLITAMTFVKIVAQKNGLSMNLGKIKASDNVRESVKQYALGHKKSLTLIIAQSMGHDYLRER